MRRSISLVAATAALALSAVTAFALPTFQGFAYATFGAATATQFGNDSLKIANIGSSGNDGVTITLPNITTGDFVMILNGLPPGTPVTGSVMVATTMGTVNGVPNQTVAIRRQVITSDPTHPVQIRDDFSAIGADHIQYQAYQGRNCVVSHTTAAGDTAACITNAIQPDPGPTTGLTTGFWSPTPGGGHELCADMSVFTQPSTSGQLHWPWGPPNTYASEVVITPLSSGTLATVSNLTSYSLRASNRPTITISSLSVQSQPYTVPSASLPAIAFGGVALLVAGIVALRRGSVLA